MKFDIKKDKYLNCWIVWLKFGISSWLDICHKKTKKECKEWLKTII